MPALGNDWVGTEAIHSHTMGPAVSAAECGGRPMQVLQLSAAWVS